MLPFAVVMLGFFLLSILVIVIIIRSHTMDAKRAKLLDDLKEKQAERQLIDLEAQVIDAAEEVDKARELLKK